MHSKQFHDEQWKALNEDFNWITNFDQRDVGNWKLYHQKFISRSSCTHWHPPGSNIVFTILLLKLRNFWQNPTFWRKSRRQSRHSCLTNVRNLSRKENCFCQSCFLKNTGKVFFYLTQASKAVGEAKLENKCLRNIQKHGNLSTNRSWGWLHCCYSRINNVKVFFFYAKVGEQIS